MSNEPTDATLTTATPTTSPVERTVWGRLVESQTAIDFVGLRKFGFLFSAALIVITGLSLVTRELNLGIDFEGGVSWDVPADNFTIDDAVDVLEANGLSADDARLQERSSESTDFVKVQVGDQPAEVGEALRSAFAEAAGVPDDEINVNLVSSTWGSEITEKAVRALVIFLVLVALFISVRLEWRMALAAILAMLHDVLISVGIYSLFQFLVTPSTVIAFLTILGFSLYDTIVVFDRVRENEARVGAKKPPYADIVNVSTNQVLMRSFNTSFSAIVPVLSLLLIGAGLMGQPTLADFALALLIGMVAGAYSSIMVAVPLMYLFKRTDREWRVVNAPRALGEDLRAMVMGASLVGGRRARGTAAAPSAAAPATAGRAPAAPAPAISASPAEQAKAVLTHPPRPRKKTRR